MSNQHIHNLFSDAAGLLKKLISTPSFSKEEDNTAEIIDDFLNAKGVNTYSYLNNIWAKNKYFDERKPTILLNSHHDTVKPNKAYTLDPFTPLEQDGKLYGLGSNDAGGCLVSLIATFIHYYKQENLQYNLVIAASAEEEISGHNGIEILLPRLPEIDFGIVGEPTLMNMAVAEKGLLVLDCTAHGRAGHAAREEGENAIYKALKDIEWFRTYKYDKVSDLLGPMKMSVTIINAGSQHNVVPHECKFTVDVRVNELHTFEEVLETIRSNVSCDVQPRSSRLRSTSIATDHPLIQAGITLGRSYYGSPTTSDKALMHFPTLKMGPGDSARSHTADEFIYIDEIRQGIALYIQLLDKILL
ncbi:M20 family metallo-hydrolase [Panacibacter sp. DH6]|uniref:M20 family metallo-hydrolase n=1 Tax=Panacibacter microcysteis TaxID=2793269 RepID=A0A931GW93_9BACT|nr:M20 family metallo-hydrolase [Panacibacter microcysteis]MBG9376033.1 M20 family metallo-hydrolase [Panacibacter microcysteis]